MVRHTRASTSSPSARTSYNDDVELPKLLNETNTMQAMSYPCYEFRMASGLHDHFINLCETASLTRLMTHEVQQYPRLTYYFVNWFKFNDGPSPTIEFRYYEDTLTMPLVRFCEILGVQNVGKTGKMKEKPYALKALFHSLCSENPRVIRRGKIRGIQFPHVRYFSYYIA